MSANQIPYFAEEKQFAVLEYVQIGSPQTGSVWRPEVEVFFLERSNLLLGIVTESVRARPYN